METSIDPEVLRKAAGRAVGALKTLANEDRLLLLCQLSQGEMSVGELEERLGIHQPTLSQQLSVLRSEGVVSTRRQGKNIYYQLASRELLELLALLYRLYCPEGMTMTMAWTAFTPWTALAGGVLIGVAAVMFVLLNGRIAGISGVLGGLLKPGRGDIAWRVAFVLGLVSAPLVYGWFAAPPRPHIDASDAALVIAGLLVGVGTRYGSGCTSGHGVCGLSRLSPRSLAATVTFMAAGFGTVFALRHLVGV